MIVHTGCQVITGPKLSRVGNDANSYAEAQRVVFFARIIAEEFTA
jgi:hypothetical protein